MKEVGTDIKHVQPGDKVILCFNQCRECNNCKLKLPGYCDNMGTRTWLGLRPDWSFTLKSTVGKSIHGNFFGQSSFSRIVIANRSRLVKVKLFAPLGCGVQTGTVWLLMCLTFRKEPPMATMYLRVGDSHQPNKQTLELRCSSLIYSSHGALHSWEGLRRCACMSAAH